MFYMELSHWSVEDLYAPVCPNSRGDENLHFFTEGGVWVLELVLRAASQRWAGREEVNTQVREVSLHRLTDILRKKNSILFYPLEKVNYISGITVIFLTLIIFLVPKLSKSLMLYRYIRNILIILSNVHWWLAHLCQDGIQFFL